MPKSVSLTMRAAGHSQSTSEAVAVLVTIAHPSLPQPARLSSDPTKRLSIDPLAYGTVSQGHEFAFVMMSALLPDDQQDGPPRSTLVFENVDRDMAAPLRVITTPVSVDLRVVMAATPDAIEQEYTGLQGVRSAYDAHQVSLDISREPFTSLPWPAGRMTKNRFPGLFR